MFWKKKEEKSQVNVSKDFQSILNSNKNLKEDFNILVDRMNFYSVWTKDVCMLFKVLLEDLFGRYNLKVNVKMSPNPAGAGTFLVEVLEEEN